MYNALYLYIRDNKLFSELSLFCKRGIENPFQLKYVFTFVIELL